MYNVYELEFTSGKQLGIYIRVLEAMNNFQDSNITC